MGKTANKAMGWDCLHSATLRQSCVVSLCTMPENSIFHTLNQEIICLFVEVFCVSNVAGSWNGVINAVTFGTMEADPELHPDRHIFVGSRALWIKIADGLPENDEFPPQTIV